MEPVPPFRGIHNVADSNRQSTGILQLSIFLRLVGVLFRDTYYDRKRWTQYKWREPINNFMQDFTGWNYLDPLTAFWFASFQNRKMKPLTYLVLCLAPLAIASGQDAPVPGKVTLVYFWAAWCGPCKALSPALQNMASNDADIALRKIDLTDSGSESYGVDKLPTVKVYNRGGSLAGTVVGADLNKIKSYVAQAKSG